MIPKNSEAEVPGSALSFFVLALTFSIAFANVLVGPSGTASRKATSSRKGVS